MMTAKQIVLEKYPNAHPFIHKSGYIEIITGIEDDAYSLGGGDTKAEAWEAAKQAIEELDDMDLLKEL